MEVNKKELVLKFIEEPEKMKLTHFPNGLTVLSDHKKDKFHKIDLITFFAKHKNGSLKVENIHGKIFLSVDNEQYLLSENEEDLKDIRIFIDLFMLDIEKSINHSAENTAKKIMEREKEFKKYVIKCQFDEDFDNFKKHIIKHGSFSQENNNYASHEEKFHFINEYFFFKQIQSKCKEDIDYTDEVSVVYKGIYFNFYYLSIFADLV